MKKAINSLVLLGALAGVLAVGLPANADIKEVFTKNCKKCHGEDGKGQTAKGKKEHAADWTTAEFQKGIKDDEIVKAILEGKSDSKGKMKGMKDKVSEAEAKELVKVVRGFGPK